MAFQEKANQTTTNQKTRSAFVTWWTFILLSNNNDFWYCNKETLAWDFFFVQGEMIACLGVMLSIKAKKLEGK